MSDQTILGSTRMDGLLNRQQRAWQAGERLTVEQLIAGLEPALADNELLELIYAEVLLRSDRGETSLFEEYGQRFPQLANSLKRLFSVHVAMEAGTALQVNRSQISEATLLAEKPASNSPTDLEWKTIATPLEAVTHDQQDNETTERVPDSERAGKTVPKDLQSWLKSILQPSPTPGDLGLFGDYRIKGILGHGGMGVVLKGWERKLERPVALKLILPQAALRDDTAQRFLREARAAAAILHQRIVPIFAVGEVNGIQFLAMPLLKGQSLGSRLKSKKRLPLLEALQYARETAEGLAVAHARGLTHRDIKPDNLWLEETDDGWHVRILDFGLARGGAAQAITHDGGIVGTPQYMAPEQASGKSPDPKADLFSLGCVLYEMLAGERAFQGDNLMAILSSVASHHPPALSKLDSTIPLEVSNLVGQLLEKDPQQRFDSAEKLVSVLRRLETNQADPAATQSWPARHAVTANEPQVEPVANPTPVIENPAKSPLNNRRRRFLIGVPLVAVVLFGLAYNSGLGRKADSNVPSITNPVPKTDAVPAMGELRLKSFQINHFARTSDGNAEVRGVLGESSFGVRVGDQVTLDVEFSHPAYAYLVAFRPDGVLELIHPDHADQPPPKTDHIRYPTAEHLDTRYQFEEGAGLCIFAVAASDQPLPPFQQWAEEKPNTWQRIPTKSGTVLHHDGSWIETKSARIGPTRAKAAQALGSAKHLDNVMQYLKSRSQARFTAGLAITVEDQP